MPTTVAVDICNMALSHLCQGVEIVDLDTEKSEAAKACRRFFDVARDKALADTPWPFAKAFADLAQVEADPTEEWKYSYRVPSDCLVVRRIRSGARLDDEASEVEFVLGQDDNGGLLLTDVDPCPVEYTKRVEDVSKWPVNFQIALSFLLAYYIVPRMASGDPAKLRQDVIQGYAMEASKAQATVLNQERARKRLPSSFERSR